MTPAELRRIAEAATPGPWEAVTDGKPDFYGLPEWRIGNPAYPPVTRAGMTRESAEFIATFNPSKVLELLDRIEMLEREHGEMTEVIEPQNEHIRELTKATYVRQARLAAVEKLHSKTKWHCENVQHTNPEVGCPDCAYICAGCGEVWPCLSIKAIKGDPK